MTTGRPQATVVTGRRRRGCGRRVRRPALIGLLLSAVMTVAGLGPTTSARADADPASAALTTRAVYLPPDSHASPAQAQRLRALLHDAARAGLPLRVAVIPSEYDLGSVTAVWRRPRVYAHFLSDMLAPRQPAILAVMPDGLGFSWPGHANVDGQRRLSRISIGPGAAGLLTATRTAVSTLTAAAVSGGVAAHRPSGAGAQGFGAARIAGIIAAAFIIAVASAVLVVRGRRMWRETRSGAPSKTTAAARAGGVRRVLGRRRWWTVPGVAALGCVSVALPILFAGVLRPARATSAISLHGLGTPYTYAPGQRRAPTFRLRGEDGRPLSPRTFRRRPLIITFVDPLCRNLCPLAAHVLNQVDLDLPPARRPAILAVSVDPQGQSPAILRDDDRMWDLTPRWHWAVGSRRALQAVWRRYGVDVSVTSSVVDGIRFPSVTHSEVAYLVDRSGDVRALYSWPFYPQNVELAVRQLGAA